MSTKPQRLLGLARKLQGEVRSHMLSPATLQDSLAKVASDPSPQTRPIAATETESDAPGEHLVSAYDELVRDPELRQCTRRLFAGGHYGKAVEEAFICLDCVVQEASGIEDSGKSLMFAAFHWKQTTAGAKPPLRVNPLRDSTDKVEQEGFGHIAAGCMMACRNPRAHRHGVVDDCCDALTMVAWADLMVRRVRAAKRTRRR